MEPRKRGRPPGALLAVPREAHGAHSKRHYLSSVGTRTEFCHSNLPDNSGRLLIGREIAAPTPDRCPCTWSGCTSSIEAERAGQLRGPSTPRNDWGDIPAAVCPVNEVLEQLGGPGYSDDATASDPHGLSSSVTCRSGYAQAAHTEEPHS
jgi:hypothetical protein